MPVLPALRHRAVQPRAGPARRLPRRGGRVGLRPAAPRRRGPGQVPGGATALVVWTTTPWTLLSNTGVAVNPELTYAVVDGMVVAEELVEAVLRRPAPSITAAVRGGDWSACATGGRSTSWPPPHGRRRLAGRAGRLRDHRGGHRARPPGPGLRRGGPPGRPGARPAHAQPGRARRPLHRGGRLAGRPRGAGGQPRHQRRARGRGAPRSGGMPYVHSYPHCWRCRTPLIYWGKPQLVHRHLDPQGRPPGRQRRRSTGTRPTSRTAASASGWPTTSTGRCRATGTGARRCRSGAAGPATSPASARWPSSPSSPAATCSGLDPHRPAIDEVTFPCPTAARTARRRARGVRRVEPVIDAWFDSGSMPAAQVGYPHVPGSDRGVHLPGRLHLRGDRPDPGLVLLAAGHQHAGLRRSPRTATSCASATSSTPRAARCPSRSATSSTPGRSSTRGARTRCAGGCSARARRGPRPGRRWVPSTRRCARRSSRCGTPSASSPPTRRQRVRPGRPRASPSAGRPGRSTGGSSRAWPRRRPR